MHKRRRVLVALATVPVVAVAFMARGGPGAASGPSSGVDIPVALAPLLQCGDPTEPRAEGILEVVDGGAGSKQAGQSVHVFLAHRWPGLSTDGFVSSHAVDRAVYRHSQGDALRMIVVVDRGRSGSWNVTQWAACNSTLLAGTEAGSAR